MVASELTQYVVTGLLSIVVAIRIVRDPRPRTLILGLAATTLIWFGFLTQMHERYAYGALVFLLLLIPERPIQWLSLAFGVVFTLDLWTVSPPAAFLRDWLPKTGVQTMVGALAMIAITWLVILLMSRAADEGRAAPDHRVAVEGGAP